MSGRHRIFLALPLPDALVGAVTLLQHMLPLRRPVPADQLHVTLAFLGEIDGPAVDALHVELEAVRAAPVPIALRGIDTFGGERPRVIHAPVVPDPALSALRRAVGRAVRDAGLSPDARRFVPHVTLARERPRGPDLMRLEQAVAAAGDFAAGPVSARGLVLFESHLHPEGARHDPLAVYPLDAAADG